MKKFYNLGALVSSRLVVRVTLLCLDYRLWSLSEAIVPIIPLHLWHTFRKEAKPLDIYCQ